jgi:hypothetical protein
LGNVKGKGSNQWPVKRTGSGVNCQTQVKPQQTQDVVHQLKLLGLLGLHVANDYVDHLSAFPLLNAT